MRCRANAGRAVGSAISRRFQVCAGRAKLSAIALQRAGRGCVGALGFTVHSFHASKRNLCSRADGRPRLRSRVSRAVLSVWSFWLWRQPLRPNLMFIVGFFGLGPVLWWIRTLHIQIRRSRDHSLHVGFLSPPVSAQCPTELQLPSECTASVLRVFCTALLTVITACTALLYRSQGTNRCLDCLGLRPSLFETTERTWYLQTRNGTSTPYTRDPPLPVICAEANFDTFMNIQRLSLKCDTV